MNIYIGNDNLITLAGLKNQATDAFVNDATVTYTLQDKTGSAIDTGSMTHVTGSDGDYRTTLEDDLNLTNGELYTLTITADAGSDVIGAWTTKFRARTRSF